MAAGRNHVVVVLGMHRSGTSLAMSVVHSLGVECGEALIPPGRGNPAGFWEHAEIVRIHEHLLASLDRVWHGPSGTYPLPGRWLDSGAARSAKDALVRLVRQQVDAAKPGVWGFKDPRTARLLPLWNEVLDGAGATPVFILMFRHPVAVRASLLKQNGVDEARGQLVWLQHNLAAIEHAGDALRLVVDFDRLVDQPAREVERIAGALDGFVANSPADRDRAAERISRGLRSHGMTGAEIEIRFIREVYEGLSRLALDQDRPASLLPLADRYREAERLFAPWRRDQRSLLTDWVVRALLRRKYG